MIIGLIVGALMGASLASVHTPTQAVFKTVLGGITYVVVMAWAAITRKTL